MVVVILQEVVVKAKRWEDDFEVVGKKNLKLVVVMQEEKLVPVEGREQALVVGVTKLPEEEQM